MDEISKDYTVYKVNVDDHQDLALNYSVMSIPCVIAFNEGKEINRSIGFRPKDDIIDMIK